MMEPYAYVAMRPTGASRAAASKRWYLHCTRRACEAHEHHIPIGSVSGEAEAHRKLPASCSP